MRTGASGKQTIADADRPAETEGKPIAHKDLTGDAVLNNVRAGRCGPWMPHTELGREELELAYPSLEAVEELELNDLTRVEDDLLYGAGMKVVQAILDEMFVSGRTRRATPEEALKNQECTAQRVNSRAPCQTLSRRSERFQAVAANGAAISE